MRSVIWGIYERNGILHYLLDLKAQGVVKHIGLSTHAPKLANRVLDMGILDMMMFSINPMYDYGHGEFSIGSASERYSLYTRCEKEGVGISAMKPFNAGQLLDAKKSPFGQALTPAQCIQYALDRPAVLTVMQGAANVEELKRNLSYLDASAQERDYSVIGSFTPKDTKGNACIVSTVIPVLRGWISASSTNIMICPGWETYWRRSTI